MKPLQPDCRGRSGRHGRRAVQRKKWKRWIYGAYRWRRRTSKCKRYVGNTRTQIDASKRVILMNRNDRDRLLFMWTQVLLDQFTLRTFIYTYIYYNTIYNIFISLHFSDDWLLYLTQRYSLTQSSLDCSTLLFQFIISFTLWPAVLRKNKIKLMFFPKSHILFAEDGRPVGPIDWWCTMMIKMTMRTMGPP